MTKQITVLVFFTSILYCQNWLNTRPSSNYLIEDKEIHLSNLKQLTFDGENAEAYFNKEGDKLIFQSHTGDSLCDQIYIMNLKTGLVDLVSTGNGTTTCSFFEYPECKKIIYSSTHLDNLKCPQKPDYSMGYVWKLYEGYDIFSADISGKNLKRLTDAKGYDAEATFAFDGSKIIYTSLKSGDLDLWIMLPDGSEKRQLTDRLGYDGGAFFSLDGESIVWRAYYPETKTQIANYLDLLSSNSIRPMALQIWTMDVDGSNKRQVTKNKAANFGPFFFPNSKRIIFSSNLHDSSGRDFDLYAIDKDGSNLERITFFKGFDGFPMFSTNGKYLVFASNRNQKKRGETNLFVCEWVD